MLTLITGGVRSGKSRVALELARQTDISGPKCFLATAEPLDQEMKARIAKHQEERANDFLTIEEPLYLANAMETAQKESSLLLVDCLTLWVNNLLYHFAAEPDVIQHEIRSFLEAVSLRKSEMIVVTNEIGLGLIPHDPLSRRYLDELGNLNQSLARLSDEVIFMVSGVPAWIKGEAHARVDF